MFRNIANFFREATESYTSQSVYVEPSDTSRTHVVPTIDTEENITADLIQLGSNIAAEASNAFDWLTSQTVESSIELISQGINSAYTWSKNNFVEMLQTELLLAEQVSEISPYVYIEEPALAFLDITNRIVRLYFSNSSDNTPQPFPIMQLEIGIQPIPRHFANITYPQFVSMCYCIFSADTKELCKNNENKIKETYGKFFADMDINMAERDLRVADGVLNLKKISCVTFFKSEWVRAMQPLVQNLPSSTQQIIELDKVSDSQDALVCTFK